MKIKKEKIGILCVALAAVCWGLIGLFVRRLNEIGFSSMQIVALRAIGATTLLGIFFIVCNRDAFKIRLRDLWIFLGTGLGSMVFFNFCYFGSIQHTSLAIAAALLYTAPAFVGILARIFLGEKLTKTGIAGIAIAVFGCMMTSGMFANHTRMDLTGFLLGLGSGFGYALYSIFGKIAISRGYKSSTLTFYTFLVASVFTCFSLGGAGKEKICSIFTIDTMLPTTGLILISTVSAYILYTKGLGEVKASTASVFASIEPVVATILSVTVFGESITWYVIIGLICICASTFIIGKTNESE